jgi:sugar lactone lactonase YvrE
LSGDKGTLYWTNLTGNQLYAIETALLRDPKVSETDLQYAVHVAALLPSNTDGMTADRQGNIYMTALQPSIGQWCLRYTRC